MRLARWQVVRVPFPYADRPVRQYRPALVVAVPDTPLASGLAWVLMITSAENAPWPGDVAISDLAAAGLPVASVVRTAKIATIADADMTVLGSIAAAERAAVAAALGALLM